jgi:hypothetical protein
VLLLRGTSRMHVVITIVNTEVVRVCETGRFHGDEDFKSWSSGL